MKGRVAPRGRGGSPGTSLKDLWNSPYVPLTPEEEKVARRILSRQKSCGSFPIVVEKECGGLLGSWSKCHSPLCLTCARIEAKRRIACYIDEFKKLLEHRVPLTFITLTIKSHPDVRIAVEVIYEALSRLRDYRIGPRKLKDLRKRYEEELESYLDSCGLGGEARELKKREWVEWWEEFEALVLEQGSVKLKNLGMWLWHFEITFNPTVGWHPHFHGITTVKIPKFLLTVIWREVTEGLGEITDIRSVRGTKGLVELAKYEVKPHIKVEGGVDLIQSNKLDKTGGIEEEEVNNWDLIVEELKLELLIALRGRRKWIAWNFPKVERERECPHCGRAGCKVVKAYRGRWLQDGYRLTYRDLKRLEAGKLELGVEWTVAEFDPWSGEEWIEEHTGLLYYDTASRSFLIRLIREKT